MKNKQLNNLKYQISYTLFILLFLLGAIFYRQAFLGLFSLILLIFPFILLYITNYFQKKMKVEININTQTIEEGNPISLEINITNPTILPFLNCEIDFSACNLYYPNTNKNTLSFLAYARRTSKTQLSFDTSGPGMCEVAFTNLRVTDPLHLYTFYKKDTYTFKIPVYPKTYEQQFPLFPNVFVENEDDEMISTGSNPSQDIKEIREYRPGDKLQNIHWKLSAKKDELMVKELQSSAVRILVLTAETEITNLSDTLRTLFSYMLFLVKNREIFKIYIYTGNDAEINERLITNIDDVYDALLNVFYSPAYESSSKATNHYHEIYGEDVSIIKILGKEIIQA